MSLLHSDNLAAALALGRPEIVVMYFIPLQFLLKVVEYSRMITITNQVKFRTKHKAYAYRGNILDYMSGIDLSCNHLIGEIPPGIGNFGQTPCTKLVS